ncbi:hypothetical protein [Clostridium polynesiense]|uniref:hypothetical protein n=1 Tax=Clostridium polynesiense TaxID=1325933 RepID=UPI0005912320|nr:hypothetical protein [Clostridium polynesiense]
MISVEFDSLKWVNDFMNNSEPLSSKDFQELKTFTFMWDMFQVKACKGVANAQSISDFVLKDLKTEKQNRSSSVVDAYFDYFRNRYVKDKNLNELFEKMTRNTEETFDTKSGEYNVKDFIGSNLLDENPTEINKIITCLLIAYRWRSNFFMLNRDRIIVRNQYKNFNIANKFIAMILQQYRKSNE